MSAILQWLEDGNVITELPEQPPMNFNVGKSELIFELQKGDKTKEHLLKIFGTQQNLNSAVRCANRHKKIVSIKGGIYMLGAEDD